MTPETPEAKRRREIDEWVDRTLMREKGKTPQELRADQEAADYEYQRMLGKIY